MLNLWYLLTLLVAVECIGLIVALIFLLMILNIEGRNIYLREGISCNATER